MFVNSLRLGMRRVLRRPGMPLVLFVTMTIGLSVSAAIFTVAWTTLVRPFPFRDQERLVSVWAKQGEVARMELSFAGVEQLARESKLTDNVALYSAANFPVVAKLGDTPMQLAATSINRPFLSTLGVTPAVGRAMNSSEHRFGGPNAAMISYDAWQKRFGGDPQIVHRTLASPVGPVPIVGVLPQHLDFPRGAELFLPAEASMNDEDSRLTRVFAVVARLKPRVTMEEFARELTVIAAHDNAAHPEQIPAQLLPYRLVDEILGSTRHALRIILAMGLLVLLIAWFNTASIALAEGLGRTTELGVRRTVGSTRASDLARAFIESSVVMGAAALAALAIVKVLIAALLRLAPAETPRMSELGMTWATVFFVVGSAAIAAFIAAAAQVLRARHTEVVTALRASAKSTRQRSARRLLELLAASQAAFAIVTLVVAALLAQSYQRYASIDAGFSSERIVTFQLPRGYVFGDNPEPSRAFFRQLLGELRSIPGVQAAGSTLMRPLELEQGWDYNYSVEGQSVDQQRRNPLANYLAITPGYLDAMRIQRVAGRDFVDADTKDSMPVAMVSESFARRHFGSAAKAIGRRTKPGRLDSPRPWMTIVGVVRDVRSRSLTTEKLDLYTPYTESIWSPNYVAVRTSGDPTLILPEARRIVARLDKEVPLSNIRTTRELVDAQLAQPKLSAAIVMLFAGAATLLALIGFAGMLSFSVRDRAPEIGVRLAVGAASSDVLKMIVTRAALVASLGIVAGLLVSLAGDAIWRSYLYGVSGIEPRVLASVAIAFEVLAIAASVVPAIRAARTAPTTALRAD